MNKNNNTLQSFKAFIKGFPQMAMDILSRINLSLFSQFIISNFINLTILLITIGLVTKMPQGQVLPIHIFENDLIHKILNICLLYFLLLFLSLLFSHYPIYIFTALFDPKKYIWEMSCWGLMLFKEDTTKRIETTENIQIRNTGLDYETIKKYNDFLRKILVIVLYTIWTYSLIKVLIINTIDFEWTSQYLLPVLTFVIIIFCSYLYFNADNPKIKAKADGFMIVLFFINLILFLGLFLLNWGKETVFLQIFLNQFIALQVFIYRTFRKDFTLKYLSWSSNDLYFLGFLRWMGVICVLFILGINFNDSFAECINPINIILLNFIILYTLLIIPIKLGMYLSHCNESGTINTLRLWFFNFKYKHFYNSLLLLLAFAVISIINYKGKIHELKLVQSNESERIKMSEFYNAFQSHKNPTDTAIFYAAYGGGLMANYWNSLILCQLDSMNVLPNIVAMSGVSGGGIGIGNFAAGKFAQIENDKVQYKQSLDTIKHANILSLELSWMFGLDFIREYIPFLAYGDDRSHRVMNYYAHKIKAEKLVDTLSFSTAYSRLFHHYGYYPNLIFNSTASDDKYGVVSAIYEDTFLNSKFINTFPSAVNLLDYRGLQKDKSLTFYEAVSTCNRFPFISPAANVPKKGQFMDGGYFENSGIMSLLSFRNALIQYEERNKTDSIFSGNKVVLVTVRNSKNNYLRTILRDSFSDIELPMESMYIKSETGAIVSGILNLERMPRYIKRTIETFYQDQFRVVNIDLPYHLTMKDVEEALGGIPKNKDKIQKMLDASNSEIESLLKSEPTYKFEDWGVVNPPLSRLLSNPVEIYMKTMLKHPKVLRQMSCLKTSGK